MAEKRMSTRKVIDEEKKSFVLYYDYRNHLALLSDEERGRLLMALFEYAENGKEPELYGASLMAFSFIRAQMDRDAAKYAETVRKRREAGKQGGRPPKSNAFPEKQTKAKKANGFSEKQTKAKKADNDTGNVTGNVTDTDTGTGIDTTLSSEKPVLHKYGEYNNVLLTDEELSKLQAEFPDLENRIEDLSDYIASTGKVYKSHYATIRNWAKKEKKQATGARREKQKQSSNPFLDMLREGK